MRTQKHKKQKKFEVTPDTLRKLQESLNDSIKPDFKEKRDGKGKNKKRKKGKPSDGSVERNQPQGTV